MLGNKYERLTVIEQVDKSKWRCQCECGEEKVYYTSQLKTGNNKSCGCLRKDTVVSRNTTHGLSKRPEYSNWKEMNKRCFNPNNKRYEDYAGRGISVHEDFVKDFPAWLAEIGPKPDDVHKWSVGRIDNNGWYTYGNIEWQLDETQSRNHSMQANNTSGVTGIQKQIKNVSGKDYESFVACWNGLDGKKRTKNFSTNKFGFEGAKQAAIDYRNERLAELNALGAGYADSHGSQKVNND